MFNIDSDQTRMYQEAGEASIKVQNQLIENASLIGRLGRHFFRNDLKLVMICGRGSSSHAGVYARYLIETRTGLPVLAVAPSVSSVFAVSQALENTLFLAISQSGQSPDILSATAAAKRGGAFVVSIINDENSPLVALSDEVIPIRAGPEVSVAATKTFICTMSAIAHMVAEWAQVKTLLGALPALPDQLSQAFQTSWNDAIAPLERVPSLLTVSRGLAMGVVKEAALKFKETCSLHAEAFSAAEVRHGPMALVKGDYPVIIFVTGDETQTSIDAVARDFTSRSSKIFSIGNSYEGAVQLRSIGDVIPELMPMTTIQTFYRFVNELSVCRGLNPDAPQYLSKITETL
ncbi:SIS domain-containing protein [uncultured Algimonas sp.]|uniref:SIS domain-containing protein n=1 Tax=uncultured Algimonas sp. TaxID=1547920 RepID=UPI00261512C9|nr:SIS domain-containing protein [uncultured Algimonas sp.]